MATRRSELRRRHLSIRQKRNAKKQGIENLEPRCLMASDFANAPDDVAQVVAVVPQPVIRASNGSLTQARDQIVVYFNDRDLLDGRTAAENPQFYQLIFTEDTVNTRDDVLFNPTSVDYDPLTDRAVLRFAQPIDRLALNAANQPRPGAFRLRINSNRDVTGGNPATIPAILTPTAAQEPGSSLVTSFNVGILSTASKTVRAAIEPGEYLLEFPGSDEEPGHRDLPAQPHFAAVDPFGNLVADPADSRPGITTIPYNFRSNYGVDPLGTPLINVITETQKQRTREIFDIYGASMGVQFVETANLGITIATGDLRALGDPDISSASGGIVSVSGDTNRSPLIYDATVILDNAENWDDSFGGDWFQASMGEIGRILGMGITADLCPSTVTGNISDVAGGTSVYPGESQCFGVPTERVFPGDAALVHGRHIYRPEAIDIDMYRFEVRSAGVFSAESVAERLPNSSLLDTSLTLFNASGQIVSRNDDYFSEDSHIRLQLEPGTYYVGVAASGNRDYDPIVADSGLYGTSEGRYELHLDFRPAVTESLLSVQGGALDGDADGVAGGVFNFWFEANDPSRTIFVDKLAPAGGTGTIASPYNQIDDALRNIGSREIVRIVGNGSPATLGQNSAYELGFSGFGTLADGTALEVPKGVTVMIDEGAIFKLQRSYVMVGSSNVAVDRSGAALQVLGTPNAPVIFTSADDQTIGIDTNPLQTTPEPGEWGGLIFANDIDRADPARRDFEARGIFLNHVGNADIRYGGGQVTIDSVQRIINPVHLIDARPTVTYNEIRFSADAGMSANPDSFEESNFNGIDSLGVDYQAVPPGVNPLVWTGYTPDYDRVGPHIRGNLLVNNTTNGLSIRIDTLPGNSLERMAVSGRWDDTDIVHVIQENLIVGALNGGPILRPDNTFRARPDAQLVIDPGMIVKLEGSRIEATASSQIIAEGTPGKNIVFTSLLDDRFGAGGTTVTSSTGSGTRRDPLPGDWGGIYVGQTANLSIDQALIAFGGGVTRIDGSFAAFNAVEIHQAESARIANSTFENNARGTGGQSEPQRSGHGTNSPAAVFVRGSQAIIIGNSFMGTTGNDAGVISIDTNSMNAEYVGDIGTSRGRFSRFTGLDTNQGALIRRNLYEANSINGMIVRPGVVTTENVWDDTDIVHVVLGKILVPDFHSSGGLRLESSPTESLVIKFLGRDSGIITTGFPLENDDRIGGTLNVVGQPGKPVVMTSLADDTVGAGLDLSGRVQKNTNAGTVDRELAKRTAGSFQIDLNFGPLVRQFPQVVAGVERAARNWEELIEDPITVTIDIELDPAMVDGVAFLATTENVVVPYESTRGAIISDARSHEQFVSNIPGLDAINVQFPKTPENPFTLANTMRVTQANYKALGFRVPTDQLVPSAFNADEARDGTIMINQDPISHALPSMQPFVFDYNRDDGITADQLDLVGVISAGIANVLGFDSSVTEVETALANPVLPREISMTPFDLFRFEAGEGVANFAGGQRILDPAITNQVFYDGGRFDSEGIPIPRIGQGEIPLSSSATPTAAWQDPAAIGGFYTGVNIPAWSLGPEYHITDQDRSSLDVIGYDVIGGAVPGDWRGLEFETHTNDRNVGVVTEFENPNVTGAGTNGIPSVAQFVGAIAPEEKDGDENRRLGLEISGAISSRSDVDVYSFQGIPGTEIWVDVDNTSQSLDAVVELIDANGNVLARSDNSFAESRDVESRFQAPLVVTFDLEKSPTGTDFYSVNPKNPGLRMILPGAANPNELATYHLRVRSSSPTLNVLSAGQTSGNYELQIRLRELDEIEGTGVQYADIRYATDGIRARGVPRHSPLTGEIVEQPLWDNDGPDPLYRLLQHTQFSGPQHVGNIGAIDRGAIAISGDLEVLGDVDMYYFDVLPEAVQTSGTYLPPEGLPLIFDVDYADGLGRPDVSLFLYRATIDPALLDIRLGRLVASSLSSGDPDDLPAPFDESSFDDLTRGSVGKLDPLLGPIHLTTGGYVLAVQGGNTAPGDLGSQFQQQLAGNPFIRLAPLSSIRRIVDQSFDVPPETPPVLPVLIDDTSVVPFNLSDVTLFVSQFGGASDQDATVIYTVDPFQGNQETQVGELIDPTAQPGGGGGGGGGGGNGNQSIFQLGLEVGDIAFGGIQSAPANQPKEEFLFGLSLGLDDEDSGAYFVIDPGTAIVTPLPQLAGGGGGGGGGGQQGTFTDDLIQTVEPDTAVPPGEQEAMDGQGNGTGEGVQFQAYALLDRSLSDPQMANMFDAFAIGHRNTPAAAGGIMNILYQLSHETGAAISAPGTDRQAPDTIADGTGMTNIRERGVLDTTEDAVPADNSALVIPRATNGTTPVIRDGMTIVLNDNRTVEFDLGPDFQVAADPVIRDGDQFTVGGTLYEIETGPVVVVQNDLSSLPDGATLTIQDVRTGRSIIAPLVIELDRNGTVATGNVAIDLTTTDDAADLTNQIAAIVNGRANFSATASDDGNRLSFQFESSITVSPSSGWQIEGSVGGTGTLVRLEEGLTGAQLAARLSAVVPDANAAGTRVAFLSATDTSLQQLIDRGTVTSLNGAAGVTGTNITVAVRPSDTDSQIAQRVASAVGGTANGSVVTISPALPLRFRSAAQGFRLAGKPVGGKLNGMTFVSTGATITASSLRNLRDGERIVLSNGTSSLVLELDNNGNSNPSTTPVNFNVRNVTEFLTNLAAAINGNTLLDVDAKIVNGAVEVSTGITIRVGNGSALSTSAGTTKLFAVSDKGGLYTINDFTVPEGAVADYVESSAELTGIKFSGLTLGPAELENGRYKDMLFATDERGGLYAFTQQGELQEIFANGQSKVNTGINNANGLAFSSLSTNMWHQTDLRNRDSGHGLEPIYDVDDIPERVTAYEDLTGEDIALRCAGTVSGAICTGGNSFRFGDDSVNLNRNFNFPGGAHGSVVTHSFDLSEYSSNDQPALYFNYFFVAEESNATLDPLTGALLTPKRDAFRVYVTDEAAETNRGQWHLLATNDPIPNPDLPLPTDLKMDLDPNDNINIEVQELFNNSFQDVPRLRRPAGATEVTPDTSLGPNGQRDPFPFDDVTTPFPDNSNVTDAAWNAFPELNETRGVWRQARIDLSQFAGSSSLRLRFDFSTAAALDLGGLGGIELRSVAGAEIQDGDQLVIDSTVFEFELGLTTSLPVGAYIRDGEVLYVRDQTGTDAMFEFDTDNVLSNPAHIRVAINRSNSAKVVADTLVAAIDASDLALNVVQVGSRLNLQGAVIALPDPGSQIVVSGEVGTGGVPVPINLGMTSSQVAAALVQPVSSTLFAGMQSAVKLHQNTLRLYGVDVDDAGPLGVADKLIGDSWGAFTNLTDPSQPAYRGLDNETRLYDFDGDGLLSVDDPQVDFEARFEGVYVDDIIIGFASRGEEIADHRPPYTFDDPDSPSFDRPGRIPNIFVEPPTAIIDAESESILVGPYQVEIRVASSDSVTNINPLDRLTPNTTLFAPSGNRVADGQTFRISDGRNTVTFEYESLPALNGVRAGNVPIEFSTQDFPYQIAARIRDAINFLHAFGTLDITASMADGSTSGITSNSNRVNLFGSALVAEEEEPNGIAFVVNTKNASGNRVREQGQLVIQQSRVTRSEGYGITVEDTLRDLPSYDWYDPFKIVDYAQFQTGDYLPQNPVRQTRETNTASVSTSIVISSNVIAFNGEGGISFAGDPNGIVMIAPLTAAPGEYHDFFAIDGHLFQMTDVNGLTRVFEFHDLQQNAQPIAGQDYALGNIPVLFARDINPPSFPICNGTAVCQSRYNPLDWDMADRLYEAIESSDMDVTIFRGKGDELFIEGIIDFVGSDFVSFAQPGSVPFGRIINNTIVGRGGTKTDNRTETVPSINPAAPRPNVRLINDYKDVGIRIEDFARPTLINNVIVNFESGVSSDATSTTSVLGANVYQSNARNSTNINVGDFPIQLGPNAPLFVDFANGNFYPAANSAIIDSATASVPERPELARVKLPLGIALSPLVAPVRDQLGQLRRDDPSFEPPQGTGDSAFRDRGAIDRADFVGPTVALGTPQDNGFADLDTRTTFVSLDPDVTVPSFEFQFSDSSQLGDAQDGTGIDGVSLNSNSIRITENGEPLVAGTDYVIDFDDTSRILRLVPVSGEWQKGASYVITFQTNLVRDVAGNPLQDNQPSGGVQFTIVSLLGTDYGDAPAPYPTTTAANGARHDIVDGMHLGSGVEADDDGQPNDSAVSDSLDDGVLLPDTIQRGKVFTTTVVASVNGFVDGWIDFNRDGDWNDTGERIFSSRAVTAGANAFDVQVPDVASGGDTFVRIRYSSVGGLSPTGAASDGEVEDYVITIAQGNVWQNPANPLDVNNDGSVTAIDVLRIIQETNRSLASNADTGELTVPPVGNNTPQRLGFVDVNGDGFVTAIDALTVIRAINATSRVGAGEPDDVSASDVVAALAPPPLVVDPIGDMIRENRVYVPVPRVPEASTVSRDVVAAVDEMMTTVSTRRGQDDSVTRFDDDWDDLLDILVDGKE